MENRKKIRLNLEISLEKKRKERIKKEKCKETNYIAASEEVKRDR